MARAGFKPPEVRQILRTTRKRYRQPGLEAILAPRAFLRPRLLVIIAGRVISLAVTRNQIRRRLRALFQQLGFLDQPYDLIILVKSPLVAQLSYEELQAFMSHLLQRVPHEL